MEQIFKIIKPIRKNQFHWIDFDIEEGTLIKRIMDASRSMDSVHGILAEIPIFCPLETPPKLNVTPSIIEGVPKNVLSSWVHTG